MNRLIQLSFGNQKVVYSLLLSRIEFDTNGNEAPHRGAPLLGPLFLQLLLYPMPEEVGFIMPKPLEGTSRYMAGMDGLRAIAVLAVIAYHLNIGWASGGLLGVGVFFVLSGYLITNLLMAEFRRHGRIEFKSFWVRRARRLLPALFIMLAAVICWVTLFDPSEMSSLRGDVLAAALYFSNWWYIFHHVSYFAKFGPPSPLTHLWSLAVEEQFYLIWPLLLALGLRFVKKRSVLVSLTLTLALASALAMALIYQPGSNPSRVYYGTDTRAFGLLVGAALAMIWPSAQFKEGDTHKAPLWLDVLGIAGLLTILGMIWRTNEYETFLYRGGLALLSIAAALTVAALVHPFSRLGRTLAVKPLRWMGVRSYGIYLWHYPVIILTTPTVDTGSFNVIRAFLQVSASIGLAALSWHFVEEPIRHGAIGRFVDRCRTSRKGLYGALRWRGWVAGIASLGLISLAVGGLSGLVDAVPTAPLPVLLPSSSPPLTAPPSPSRSLQHPPSPSSRTSSSPHGESTSGVTYSSTSVPTSSSQSGNGVTAIGDSIMVDATPYLKKLLPGIVISSHIGRQLYQTPPVIAALKAHHQLGTRVIIELGTNGAFTKDQLVSLLRDLGPVQQIILVNTRVPRPWQNVVNSTLAQVASTYPHTTLVNWYTYSANQNGWFYPDGVHLNPTGALAYATLIARAVEPPHESTNGTHSSP